MRKHQFCGCQGWLCKYCSPEYICIACGFCPQESDHQEGDEECLTREQRYIRASMIDGSNYISLFEAGMAVAAFVEDDSLPF